MVATTPNQSQEMTALRTFLLSVLPAGTDVVQGEINRVTETASPDFVVMTPIMRERISTNVVIYADCAFTGSIAGSALTISAVQLGTVTLPAPLFGASIPLGTTILSQTSGTAGGVGVYAISAPLTVSSEQMAAGQVLVRQPSKVIIQLDIHSPGGGTAMDLVATVQAALHSDIVLDSFAASGFDVVPLYTENPSQSPFMNAQNQVELRWTMDVALQVNQSIEWPQQFAGSASLSIYPPV